MTRQCNLKCVHCRAGASDAIDPNELTHDESIKLIEGIRDQGTPILIMTGGEPLLRKDFFQLARPCYKNRSESCLGYQRRAGDTRNCHRDCKSGNSSSECKP